MALIAYIFIARDQDLFGACAYTLALNYKQMELYHSLPFFCYLLGKSLRSVRPLLRIIALGLVVIVTFGLCWLPFLFDINQAMQVIKRLFPFNRGLYEVTVVLDFIEPILSHSNIQM